MYIVPYTLCRAGSHVVFRAIQSCCEMVMFMAAGAADMQLRVAPHGGKVMQAISASSWWHALRPNLCFRQCALHLQILIIHGKPVMVMSVVHLCLTCCATSMFHYYIPPFPRQAVYCRVIVRFVCIAHQNAPPAITAAAHPTTLAGARSHGDKLHGKQFVIIFVFMFAFRSGRHGR